jgi:hypothetical protein
LFATVVLEGDSMKICTLRFSAALSLSLWLLLGLNPRPAHAKQFTKLVQVGQTVAGSADPVSEIVEPAIGFDGQVAVLLRSSGFEAIYRIPKNQPIQFVDGIIRDGGGGFSRLRGGFSAPSISQGQIAYLAFGQISTRYSESGTVDLRVATAGVVKSIQVWGTAPGTITSGNPDLAFVNGRAYFLDNLGGTTRALNFVDTRSANPTLKLLSNDPNNREIRASSQLLIKSSGTSTNVINSLTQSFGDSNFQPLIPVAANCGFSTSADNVVVCRGQTRSGVSQYNLPVRFGKAGQFQDIPLPAVSRGFDINHPSISNRSVIFKASFAAANAPTIERIYLSQDGKAPIALISTADTLDGKVVAELNLSRNGRTIADNAAVFTATFRDGTTALYRVDW